MLSIILSVFHKRWPVCTQAALVISYYRCVVIKGTTPGVGRGKELLLLVEDGVHPNPVTCGLAQTARNPLHIYVALTLKFLKSYHLEVARPVCSHNTVHPRSIHRVPASCCPQRKPFPLDSLVILDLASFHDLYTRVPAYHCPQRKPFPLDSSWAEADVTSLVLMLSPTPSAPRPVHWPLRVWPQSYLNNGPILTPTDCHPEPASNIKLEQPHQMAVPTNHNLGGHVIQLTSYLSDII